jgi:hypothetical protein
LLDELGSRQDCVKVGGADLTSEDIFGGLQPMLNYIRPRDEDVAAYAAGLSPSTPAADAQLDLMSGGPLPLLADLRQSVQASIDDAVVLESLKRARAAAQALLGSMTASEDYRHLLARFLTYSGCVLFRHKNVISAWKSVEEFHAAASDMRDDLREVIETAYRHFLLEPRVQGQSETREAVETDRDILLDAFGGPDAGESEKAVLGLNQLLERVFEYTEELARDLNEHMYSLDELNGFWDLQYTGFSAVQGDDDGAFLFNGDERVRIFDSSPIARALQQVEQNRARLCAFFFVLHPSRVPIGEAGTAQERRAKLIGEFVTIFPRFVERVLPAILADSYQPPIPTTEDPRAANS